jgi:predicted ATP-dependent endonuclease of OLD family
MAKVWTAIAQAARAADVQIFATTHSWECITAAHQAFSESDTYDFRLHRLDRIGEDIRAVTLNQKMLDTAIQSGLEVR